MSSGPIQIYLDSADYSNLSNPKVLEKDPRKKDTLDFLYQCVDCGVIEIRFSAFTVAEITHIDEDSKRYAVQRAKLLMDLTQGKTFRPVFDLFTQDAIYLGIKQTTECDTLEFPHYAYLDNNDWIDKSRWNDFSAQFKAETLRQCRQIITSLQLPRHQKKIAEKNFFRKGRLSPEVKKNIIHAL
jgi:hypothetical protein